MTSQMKVLIKKTWESFKDRKKFDSHDAIEKLIFIDEDAYLDNYKKGQGMDTYHGLIAEQAEKIFKKEIESGLLVLERKAVKSKNLAGKDSVCALWKWTEK